MSATILSFSRSKQRAPALTPLTLLQQYCYISRLNDPAQRVALTASWRMMLEQYIRQHPGEFEKLQLAADLKPVLNDLM